MTPTAHLPAFNDQKTGDEALGSQALADSSLRHLLTASWHRSMENGLRRRDNVLFTRSISKTIERRAVEENHRLLSYATPEMVKLYGGLGSPRWLALCVNARGQIVCSVGDQLSAPNELRALMHPGRSLLESELGTNAPGCALESGQPVVVSRKQHYLEELASFSCASAPIVGPEGSMAGALDISGIDVEALPIAEDMVALAVRAIENSMVCDIDGCMILHFHSDERLLETPFEGLLAVRPDGCIAGANRTARRLMSLPTAGATSVYLESFFATSIDIIQNVPSRMSDRIEIRSHAGTRTYVRVDSKRARLARSPRAPVVRTTYAVATGKFVLRDEALAQRLDKAVRALAHGMPVLLEGETGTGKEVFARALREAVRPTGPFIALNCAAIPEGLIEAELFGYTDGAFTGGRKGGAKGKIELAHDGVLLLDEIGDMPLAMQSRLLRVLQERAVMRIGGEREVPVDTLVISATHQHLENLVARGSFRQDLFYRLNGFTLQLPALRERTDIAEIVEALLREASGESDGNAESAPLTSIITLRALAVLLAHPWPGNIRQLQHTIRSMIALRCNDNPIDVTDLPAELHGLADEQDAGDCESPCSPRTLEETERRVIQRALREHGDNISAAARSLGISRTTLYKRLKNPGKTMAR